MENQRADTVLFTPISLSKNPPLNNREDLQELACYLTYCSVHFRHMQSELARGISQPRIYVHCSTGPVSLLLQVFAGIYSFLIKAIMILYDVIQEKTDLV